MDSAHVRSSSATLAHRKRRPVSRMLAFGAKIQKLHAESNDYHCETDVNSQAQIVPECLDNDKDRTDTREADMQEACESGR